MLSIVWFGGGLALGVSMLAGCQIDALTNAVVAQSKTPKLIEKDSIRIHALSPNPAQNLLLDELVELREEIAAKTGLSFTGITQPIDVYLFKDESSFRDFTSQANAVFADRRAFFVKAKEAFNVYGFWGINVAKDLRHEVTHGYLHSVIPELPLWIDEGLAEYFEVDPENRGVNLPHVRLLSELQRQGKWKPSLARLEMIIDPTALTQADYAESWLWIHYLLSSPIGSQVLTTKLSSINGIAAIPWAVETANVFGDADRRLLEHLKKLRASDSHQVTF